MGTGLYRLTIERINANGLIEESLLETYDVHRSADEDNAIGWLLFVVLSWVRIHCRASFYLSFYKLCQLVGTDHECIVVRELGNAADRWSGEVPFDECVSLVINEDALTKEET